MTWRRFGKYIGLGAKQAIWELRAKVPLESNPDMLNDFASKATMAWNG